MKKIISWLLSLCMVFAFFPAEAFAAGGTADFPSDMTLTQSTEYGIAPGISEKHITFLNDKGQQNKAYYATIDTTNDSLGFLAGYKDYNKTGKWGMQTVRDQAKAAEKATGKKIVFAVNGDYFNMTTGEPLGVLVMGGTKVKSTSADGEMGYFCITKAGKPELRDSSASLDDVQEAVGFPFFLVRNGEIAVTPDDTNNMPRVAVGIKENGEMIIMEVDGRQSPTSVGTTLYETAEVMQSLGCKDAAYFDGGGSATFASQSEGTSGLTVKNSPSDGNERAVSTTLFVYSDAEGDGVFHHASLSPSDEYYTPESTVDFDAVGCDAAGNEAELPADGVFSLEDSSFGTIDSKTGEFVSNGKTGDVTVKYASPTAGVARTTTIHVENPDYIGFANEGINLGFEAESTLGLIVKCKNVEMHYSAKDIDWELEDPKMGTFDGLTFKSSDSESITGTITAKSAADPSVKGKIMAEIGKLPSILMDFEDYTDPNTQEVTAAKDYWTFTRGTCDANGGVLTKESEGTKLMLSSYGRGGVHNGEIVDIDTGEVRFGSHALKLSWDFSGIWNTEGANIGLAETSSVVEGNPTAIGAWVYVPEGTPCVWIRCRVVDGTGTIQTLSFTDQKRGLNWTGWKYIEAPLKTESGQDLVGPYKLLGGESFRIMGNPNPDLEFGTGAWKNGEYETLPEVERKGYIYIDNMQFVYGANTDDVDNPMITSLQANNTELENGAEINSNTLSFRAYFEDVQNKYTTGINMDSTAVWLDGKNVTDKCVKLVGDGAVALDGVKLSNGEHKIKVRIRDSFNNETTVTKSFVVNGDQKYSAIKVTGEKDNPVLGGEYKLAITSDNSSDVKKTTVNIKVDKTFINDAEKDIAIECPSGFDGEFKYDEKTETVEAVITANEDPIEDDELIGEVTFKIPYNIAKGKSFSYSVPEGSIELSRKDKVSEKGLVRTFSQKESKIEVVSSYDIEIATLVQGISEGTVTVTDKDGKAVEGATVYINDKALDQASAADGTVDIKAFADEINTYTVYAEKDGKYSFATKTQSYKSAFEDNKPHYVQSNMASDSESAKNISWLSSPANTASKAVVKVAKKADYDKTGEAAFNSKEGKSKLFIFNGSSDINSNYAVRINSIEISGLAKDTEYVYVVGDGNEFSEVKSFTTGLKGSNTNFFIIGDAQAEDKTNLDTIFSKLNNSGTDFSFGVQTGDAVEQANLFSDWEKNLGAFEGISDIDVIHALGNHERGMSDFTGESAKSIFNIDGDTYSAEYGNVYVASMTYAQTKSELEERVAQVKEDAAKSNAQWKVLVMHAPPYYTNATSSSYNENELIPAMAEEAGFDFVFSGHDHSYARTAPMTQGQIDKENGITYFISGTTGGKSYTVENNPAFNFEVATQNFDAMYLTCEATDKDFTVTAHAVSGDTDEVYDTYTKTKESCKNSLHDYTTDGKYLTCKECGHAQLIGTYTGLVTDEETGIVRSLAKGEFEKSKWVTKGDDMYYINDRGFAATGEFVVNDITYTADETGLCTKGSFVEEEVTNGDGVTKTITRYYEPGGEYAVHWREIDGKMYYFKKTSNKVNYDTGEMYTGDGNTPRLVKTVGNNANRYYVFNEDGSLERGAFYEESNGKVRYYWGDEYLTGKQVIEGVAYEFDDEGYLKIKNIKDCKITLKTVNAYTGKKIKPVVTVKDGSSKLELAGKSKYDGNYTVTYSENKKIGTAKVTITGKSLLGYTGTVTKTFKIVPAKATNVKAKALSAKAIKVTWNSVKGVDGYKVYRATSKTGKFKYIATTSKTSYTNDKRKSNTRYYYKVKGYKDVNGKKYYSSEATIVSAKTLKATKTSKSKKK